MKRNKAITLLAAVILGTGLIATQAAEKKAEAKKQTTCPVMGGKVTAKSPHVDANGKRIYVCCQGCAGKIKANPDKYIKKLEAKGVVLEKAPKAVEQKKEKHSEHPH